MEQAVLLEWAREFGFAHMGVCSTAGFDIQKKVVEEQPPLAERRQLRYFPQEDCPWATALLVLLWAYSPAALPQTDEQVFVDSYYFASNQAYHAARGMETRLQQAGFRAQANVSYPAREAAVRAGLGIIGDNGLLITPQYGTRTVIILMATDAVDAPIEDQVQKHECQHCGRCAAACPTSALSGRGMEHPERCLRNFMMEGVVVPEETRKKMGMKLIGCDNCQRACPMQPKLPEANTEQFLLDDFLKNDAQGFRDAVGRLAQQIGRNAARPQRVRAQAALLAGNRRREKDIPVLKTWTQSDFEAVQVHARWALERIQADTLGLDQTDEKR